MVRVKKQADGKFYSPEDIDYGTGPSGLKNSDWDAVGHKNAYFGSGVGLANGRISFSFGMTTKGKVMCLYLVRNGLPLVLT